MGNPFSCEKIKVIFGATTLSNLKSWSFTGTVPTADSTVAHATNTGRQRLTGINQGTATATCYIDDTVGIELEQGDAQATLKLQRTDTLGDGYYTGTAEFISHDSNVDLNGVETVTYNFRFVAAVTIAVA